MTLGPEMEAEIVLAGGGLFGDGYVAVVAAGLLVAEVDAGAEGGERFVEGIGDAVAAEVEVL